MFGSFSKTEVRTARWHDSQGSRYFVHRWAELVNFPTLKGRLGSRILRFFAIVCVMSDTIVLTPASSDEVGA